MTKIPKEAGNRISLYEFNSLVIFIINVKYDQITKPSVLYVRQ